MDNIYFYYIEEKKVSKKYVLITNYHNDNKYNMVYNIINNNEDINNLYSLFYINNGICINYSKTIWDELLKEKLIKLDINQLLNKKNVDDILSKNYILFDYIDNDNLKSILVKYLI